MKKNIQILGIILAVLMIVPIATAGFMATKPAVKKLNENMPADKPCQCRCGGVHEPGMPHFCHLMFCETDCAYGSSVGNEKYNAYWDLSFEKGKINAIDLGIFALNSHDNNWCKDIYRAWCNSKNPNDCQEELVI